MLLSDITPYPVLLLERPLALTDDELRRIAPTDPRNDIARALRVKRAPPAYQRLQAILITINDQLRALEGDTLEQHLSRKRQLQQWHLLESTVKVQSAWHLTRVQVDTEEVSLLLTRWLLLLFDDAANPTRELAGHKTIGGIIVPTPGGRHD